VAALATTLWVWAEGASLEASFPVCVALCIVAGVSEHVVVQLGPRSWYTASGVVIVLAAIVGGPLVGVAAGISTVVVQADSVWRRRAAEGGLAAAYGLAAGIAGLAVAQATGSPVAVAALAVAAAVAVNTVGRFCIILARNTGRVRERALAGIRVDVTEAVIVVPLLAVLLTVEADNPVLVVATVASLLAALFVFQRSRALTDARLAAEEVNARRDSLTGAPNRRAFEEAMAIEHARIMRGGQPAGLFVVDLDRFKSVNDRFGHGVGDQVLIEVVDRLAAGLRPTDVVARWGGEEIAVLAPGVRGRRQLEQFANRIRGLIRELPIATSTTVLPVTVSVGGTLLDGSMTPAVAFDRADSALYDAKRTRDAASIAMPPRLTLRLDDAA
jgi:diguanylate cyclase (GGDEF)-like protein